jgi:tetratricopeptide (TPR) repeat protein
VTDRPAAGGDWRERRPERRSERSAPGADRPTGRDRGAAGDRPESAPRRPAGPELPEWADARELDPAVRTALRGLDPRNAELVGRHLVAAGGLVDDDPELALEHARAARDRASRLAPVREAVGVAAYHAEDYAEAARELRAYARMSGDESYRAVLADCERALGRPENALRLVQEALDTQPDAEELVELRLVEAGARQDLGEEAAAALVLEAALGGRPTPAGLGEPDLGRLRLATAYADLLEDRGDTDLAHEWYSAIAAADPDDLTGVSDHFSEEDEEDGDEAADDVDVVADEVTDDGGADGNIDTGGDTEDNDGGSAEVADADLGRALAEELGGDVPEDDIEAEVAELLGEIPPPVERDHTRLFQEAAPDQEQVPPTD